MSEKKDRSAALCYLCQLQVRLPFITFFTHISSDICLNNFTLNFLSESGLSEAKRWTEAFFSDSPETLACLSDTDMKRLFDYAPTIDLLFQYDMTVLDLVMKSKSFDREGALPLL